MGNKFKQQLENIEINKRALKKAKTETERRAAESNLKAAEQHLENLKKSEASYKKKKKKGGIKNKKKKAGCLWTILKFCTLGILAAGAKK